MPNDQYGTMVLPPLTPMRLRGITLLGASALLSSPSLSVIWSVNSLLVLTDGITALLGRIVTLALAPSSTSGSRRHALAAALTTRTARARCMIGSFTGYL